MYENSQKKKTCLNNLIIPLIQEKMWTEPRLCDYSGLYYCPTCHWNSVSIIPARVIHNWDFSSHKVSRTSLQQINLLLDKPVIKLEEVNPKLFVFLQKLSVIKKIREDLTFMRKYLCECRVATEKKLLEGQIGKSLFYVHSISILIAVMRIFLISSKNGECNLRIINLVLICLKADTNEVAMAVVG